MSIRILPHCLVGAGFACLKTSTWMHRGADPAPTWDVCGYSLRSCFEFIVR